MKAFVYMMVSLLLIGAFIPGCSEDSGQTVEAMNTEALQLLRVGAERSGP